MKPIDLLRFSISSYNTGAGNAIKGYHAPATPIARRRTRTTGATARPLRIVTAWLDKAPIPCC